MTQKQNEPASSHTGNGHSNALHSLGLTFPLEHLHVSRPATPGSCGFVGDIPIEPNGTAVVDVSTETGDYFDQPIKHVILDCSSMCFVDINGVQAIKDLAAQCAGLHVTLFLTSCKAEMRQMLALCGFAKDLTPDHIFMHVHDAVTQAVREHEGVSWEVCRLLIEINNELIIKDYISHYTEQ